MAAADFDWGEESLTDEDYRLIRAYVETMRPLDDLAYTRDFTELLERAGFPTEEEEKHRRFKQLLNLRKRGRLPRVLPGVGIG